MYKYIYVYIYIHTFMFFLLWCASQLSRLSCSHMCAVVQEHGNPYVSPFAERHSRFPTRWPYPNMGTYSIQLLIMAHHGIAFGRNILNSCKEFGIHVLFVSNGKRFGSSWSILIQNGRWKSPFFSGKSTKILWLFSSSQTVNVYQRLQDGAPQFC
jgi:hypothetical protein